MAYSEEKINRNLQENDSESSEFQKNVVQLCLDYAKTSADEMSSLYDGWDSHDLVYRGYRALDKDDKESVKKGDPPKIIVPITYAQTQTALSFIFSTFAQKPMLYELVANGPEDEKNKSALEMDINYQMVNQKAMFKLYCYLLDAFKYGFGVMKTDWTESYCKMRVGKKVPKMDIFASIQKMFGRSIQEQFETVESVEDVLQYQGNRLSNISPYSFFPDPSVTIAKFQEGKFVAHDEETSMREVTAQEGQEYWGTDKIPNSIPAEDMRGRKRKTGSSFAHAAATGSAPGPGQDGGNKPKICVRLEVEFVMTEKEASEEFKFDLGNGRDPIKWIAVVGNDKKLIKFKQAGYLHNMFNYNLSEFSPDNNSFYNPGLSDTIYELQNLITFFLNSHVVNVKKIIQNRFVGDESKFYKEDLTNNAMFIRLKQSGVPIDRILTQLQMQDVTSHHVQDMDTLIKLVQIVTGINENALGQYSSGRRSATEARSVNAGAAARLKMQAQLMWMQGLEPLGRQVLANTRQGRTKEVYEKIVGTKALEAPFESVIFADPDSLAGGYDFSPYDATLPSDKSFQANVFQELFTVLVQNPQTIQLLNKDPTKLLNHIAELYGIKNIQDFDLTANPSLPPLEAQVMPDKKVQEGAADGNMEPVQDANGLLQELAAG